jgi:hypothetical protein
MQIVQRDRRECRHASRRRKPFGELPDVVVLCMRTDGKLRSRIIISVAIPAALMFALASGARAQAKPTPRTDTLSARVRDSLIAAVLADTADIDPDEEMALVPRTALRQSFTIRPTLRKYTIGSVDASEQASYASWVARFPRLTVRLDMTPVAYSGDTTAVAGRPQVSFGGASPISGRLDVLLRRADTLRVFVQSASFPGALSNADAQALGAVGTGTIDLDAGALGVAARTGVRYAATQPIGDDGVTLTLRGGVEYDPKPSGTQVVSWRGTTLRGGVGVSRATENATFGAAVEVTRSYADSLGGRNLFPGGGNMSADARMLRYFGDDGLGLFSLNAFYSQPINIQRPDQPTRLIPVGNFLGLTSSASIPLGALSLLPTVSVLRESSSASATLNTQRTTLTASGYTASASVGLAVPVGRYLTLTPEVGAAFGSVNQTVTSQFPRRFGRPLARTQAFSDPIRGGWVALEVAVTR